MIDIKSEIIQILYDGGTYENRTDRILSIVIQRDKVCGFCVGRKKLKNIFTGAILNCSHCNGTGKDPDITVKDAILRVLETGRC